MTPGTHHDRDARIGSYVDLAAADGSGALDAIPGTLAGKPGLLPLRHPGLTLAWHQFTTYVNGHLNRAQGNS
jgi:hypothetical protein